MLSVASDKSADSDPGENRTAARRPASAFPEITGLRFSPHGVEATLVNISASGLLAECDQQIKPGSVVTVAFAGTFDPKSTEGRVARCVVSAMGKGGRLRYHVGVAFRQPIRIADDTAAAAPPAPAAQAAAAQAAAPSSAPAAAMAASVAAPPAVVRNRW